MATKAKAIAANPGDAGGNTPKADKPVTSTLDLLRAASRKAQADGDHAAHAALEDALSALHVAKAKVDASIEYVGDELMDAMQHLRAIL